MNSVSLMPNKLQVICVCAKLVLLFFQDIINQSHEFIGRSNRVDRDRIIQYTRNIKVST